MLLNHFFDFAGFVPSSSEPSTDSSRKRRSVERRKDWPLAARRSERLVQPFEWIVCLKRKRRFLVGLVLSENDERASVEIDVAPAKSTPTLVVRIAKDLPTTHT
jgi:hypothetical protein